LGLSTSSSTWSSRICCCANYCCRSIYRVFSWTIFSDLGLILGKKSNLLSSYYALMTRAISFFSFSMRPYIISSSSFFRLLCCYSGTSLVLLKGDRSRLGPRIWGLKGRAWFRRCSSDSLSWRHRRSFSSCFLMPFWYRRTPMLSGVSAWGRALEETGRDLRLGERFLGCCCSSSCYLKSANLVFSSSCWYKRMCTGCWCTC
jgi:hypothetical protein